MKKKMTSFLALFCMMFCAGASAQSAYQKAYDKAKSKSLVNALSFSLEKDKERLRKAAYKYREDIPKEVLKMPSCMARGYRDRRSRGTCLASLCPFLRNWCPCAGTTTPYLPYAI